MDATSIPVSTVIASASAVDTNSSVELPTSVVDSTSVLSTPSLDVNPTSVGKSRTMVNPVSGLLTTLTEQQQQYIAQATVDAIVAHIPDSVYRIRIPEPDKEYRISDTG